MHRKTFTLLFLLTIFTSSSITFSTLSSMASSFTSVSVEPRVITGLEIGNSFTINITVTNVTDLYAWQFILYYKSSILNATGKTEGPFLKRGAPTFFNVANFTDNYNATHGMISLAATRLAPSEEGIDGTGVLATVTFMTKAYGNSPLHLTETLLIDSAVPFGKKISHEVHDGRVHVGLIDVAIINVEAPLFAPMETIVLVNVTVENQGVVTQTFDVTFNYDGNPGETKTIFELVPEATQTVTFVLDTTPLKGEYPLTATATQVPGETDTEDNNYDAGTILITILGDVTGDFEVNIIDIATIALAFGSEPGDTSWNPYTDLDHNNLINIIDLSIAAINFGAKI